MILDKIILIKGHSKNITHYRKLGYDLNVGQLIEVKTEDLTKGSSFIIKCQCDECGSEKKMEFKEYFNRTKSLTDKYYCFSCKSIKTKNTNIERWGFDNPMKSESVKNKLKNKIIETYGVDHYSKTDEYKIKYKNTCLEKYGVDNASKFQSVKDSISNLKFIEKNSLDKYREKISDEYNIISYNRDRVFEIYHKKCKQTFNIFIGTFYDRSRNDNIICTKCNIVDQLSSSKELELKEFIKSKGVDFIENSYDIIKPLSLDIYLPDLKIAFEFNGIYWHSELFKNKNYHLNKTLECEKNGIKLIHIWEDDWMNKNQIVKSIISNKLGFSNKLYARKCELKLISDVTIVRKFLDENHIQGYSNSNIKLGLYYQSELVSLMIFGKKRKQMELVRFCNKLNYQVVGAASKLFSYFIKNYQFDEIISFSDNSMFDGKMYESLGFKFEYNTPINYHWVVDGIRRHRFSFNKKSLVGKGHDKNLSESQIMNELGYYKIWECGMKKWIFKPPYFK